jgi:hypothetical protein
MRIERAGIQYHVRTEFSNGQLLEILHCAIDTGRFEHFALSLNLPMPYLSIQKKRSAGPRCSTGKNGNGSFMRNENCLRLSERTAQTVVEMNIPLAYLETPICKIITMLPKSRTNVALAPSQGARCHSSIIGGIPRAV